MEARQSQASVPRRTVCNGIIDGAEGFPGPCALF